jgi:hypothetical protein
MVSRVVRSAIWALLLLAGIGAGVFSPGSAGAQEDVPGSLTVTVYDCPAGMTAETLVPEDCALSSGGFDIAIGSRLDLMEPLTLADASFDGTSYIWDLHVPYKWFLNENPRPEGADSYTVLGDVQARNQGGNYPFDTTAEAPNPVASIYNFFPAAGSDVTTITIHERACYGEAALADPYPNCHDNLTGAASEYQVLSDDPAQSALTDPSTGNVSFEVTGTYAIIVDPWNSGSLAFDIDGQGRYCAFTESGEPIEITPAGAGQSGGSSIEFPAGSDITCDFYYGIADSGTATPTPAPTMQPTATATATATMTVTKLPSTGTGTAPVQQSAVPFAEIIAALVVVVMAGGAVMRIRRS